MRRAQLALVVGSLAMVSGAFLASAEEKVPTTGPAPTPGVVSGGDWKSADGVLEQTGSDTPALLLFGDKKWKDYTLELEAQKTGGDEGFLIAVRAKDADNLVWFNVGGWNNSRTAFEGITNGDKTDFAEKQTYASFVEVQQDKWHKLKVTVAGNKIEGFLDGKSACKFDAEVAPAGGVGIGTWSTQAKFRKIKVTSADGKTLWEGMPTLSK
jgi:hypothetical protein